MIAVTGKPNGQKAQTAAVERLECQKSFMNLSGSRVKTEGEQTFSLRSQQEHVIPPMAERMITAAHSNACRPCAAIVSGPGVVEAVIQLSPGKPANCSLRNETEKELRVAKGERIAAAEAVEESQLLPLVPTENPLCNISARAPCGRKKEEYLKKELQLDHLPDVQKMTLTRLILNNHDVFSDSRLDVGHATAVKHSIALKDEQPVHVKQFRVPWAHMEFINDYIDELLAKGCIEPSRSAFNAPLFCVPKGPEK